VQAGGRREEAGGLVPGAGAAGGMGQGAAHCLLFEEIE